MQMYNETLDMIIENIRPVYQKGFVKHYTARDAETGLNMRIGREELKGDWQDTRYVDVEALRGNTDIDDFILKTML